MTKDFFNLKWGNIKREDMTVEQERLFVDDCFALYESEGFAERFYSPYNENKAHNGKKFTVLGRATEEDCDLETLPAWHVRFEDGNELCCYPEEIMNFPILSVGDAEQMMRDLLSKESMGDRVYEFAQNLFQRYINVIHAGHRIANIDGVFEDDNDHGGEAWYDGIQEEFFQAVYDRMSDFLNNRE